jgi:hypothetical protein
LDFLRRNSKPICDSAISVGVGNDVSQRWQLFFFLCLAILYPVNKKNHPSISLSGLGYFAFFFSAQRFLAARLIFRFAAAETVRFFGLPISRRAILWQRLLWLSAVDALFACP